MAADAEASAARVTAEAWLDRAPHQPADAAPACGGKTEQAVAPTPRIFYFAVAAVLAVLVAFVRELWSRAL